MEELKLIAELANKLTNVGILWICLHYAVALAKVLVYPVVGVIVAKYLIKYVFSANEWKDIGKVIARAHGADNSNENYITISEKKALERAIQLGKFDKSQ
jgi:hypothetical protein